jgi:DNA-binding transcriptional LysR family regulator
LRGGEQRHALAQAICTFKQGRIADRGVEAQQYRASGLNLIIAAIVYWNSTYLADAIAHLRAGGEILTDDQLAHTSPVTWEHIGLLGDFLWLPGIRQVRLFQRPSIKVLDDHFFVTLQAVVDGLGIGIGPLPVLQTDVAAGRLLTPFSTILVPRTGYVALIPFDANKTSVLTNFIDWLVAEGAR